MQSSGRIPLMATLMVPLLVADCCRADDLVGVWQTETNHWSAAGHTNRVEGFETLEFFKERSFKITDITIVDGKRWTNIPYTGTYKVLGTNRVSLKVVAHDIPPGATPPCLTVSGSIVGNELELPKFITSVVPEYKRYRRAK
jgi:hypothetical protein